MIQMEELGYCSNKNSEYWCALQIWFYLLKVLSHDLLPALRQRSSSWKPTYELLLAKIHRGDSQQKRFWTYSINQNSYVLWPVHPLQLFVFFFSMMQHRCREGWAIFLREVYFEWCSKCCSNTFEGNKQPYNN